MSNLYMYKKWYYLTEKVWNNAFSYNEIKNKQLYIPKLIEIDNFNEIKLQNDKSKIAFEDFWFDDKLSTNYGLENFYKIKWEGKDIYLFDNHNHAYYFWYLSRKEGIIWDENTLIHIDEHADTRDNDKHLLKPDTNDLDKVFDFTNKVLNVGDYIIPAQEEGIIWNIVQIRNTSNLEDYLKFLPFPRGVPEGGGVRNNSPQIILNLDLDFFQPDLDFIDYELKKKVVLDAANKASIITVSTSPFFIEQELAVRVFKDIFW